MSETYGTDSGPVHVCGGTIYQYDLSMDGEVLVTCVTCGLRGHLYLSQEDPSVQNIRKAHEELAFRHGRMGGWPYHDKEGHARMLISEVDPVQEEDRHGRKSWWTYSTGNGRGQIHFCKLEDLKRQFTDRGTTVQVVSLEFLEPLMEQAKKDASEADRLSRLRASRGD